MRTEIARIGNGLDVRAIDPRRGAKYSPNLYRWLTKRGQTRRAAVDRVYRDLDGSLWIGHFAGEDLIGQRLMTVLCNGARVDSACWVTLRGLIEVEGFWARYMADGRCAIDTAHAMSFVGDDTRWSVHGNTRDCLWCGKVRQVLARWSETVVREQWRDAADACTGTGAAQS